MNFRLLSSLLLPALLAACSGGGQDQRSNLQDIFEPGAQISAQQRSMVYAFPAPGQTEVIPATPIALRFSHPLGAAEFDTPEKLTKAFTLCEEAFVNAEGECLPEGKVEISAEFSKKEVLPRTTPISSEPDRLGVVIKPKSLLKERTKYRLSSKGLMLDTGEPGADGKPTPGEGLRNVAVQAAGVGQPLTFTTRAALEGPVNARSTSVTKFDVEHITPDPTSFLLGNEGLGLFDFSTIRLQMTQPIDAKTLSYGLGATDSIKLTDAANKLVAATILVSGNKISIDPNKDLVAGQVYTLSINNRLKSLKGMTFSATSAFNTYSFTPVLASNGESAKSQVLDKGISVLLGANVNQVPVASPLLGQGERAPKPQATGELIANLGTPANIKNIQSAVVPLRVSKNSQLIAGSLVVKLDGLVPAKLETEPLTIKMISDANGLLLPNRYSLSPFAPSLVTLEMDVAVSATNSTSNGAFTQNVMHVPVSGIARFNAEKNQILLDAVGTIELKILGTDNAVGVLALQLLINLNDAPVAGAIDEATPTVQSWVPGESARLRDELAINRVASAIPSATVDTLAINTGNVSGGQLMRPGDPVIINFDQIMDVESFRSSGFNKPIMLTTGGVSVPFSWRLDGVSLVITPDSEFQYGKTYSVTLNNTIRSLAGKPLVKVTLPPFTVPSLAAGDATPSSGKDTRRPPIVLGVYPGFPCGVMPGSRNVASDIQGRCVGGKTTDEEIPLPYIDARRAITVTLSQSVQRSGAKAVKLATVCNDPNANFRVEQVSPAGVCLEAVKGSLGGTSRELTFTPDEPWKTGFTYRYILGSSGLASDTCTANSICGTNNLPLQTQLIAQAFAEVSNPQHGGPPMEIFFKVATEPAKGSVVNLRLLPNADVDANFLFEPERGEVMPICAQGLTQGIPSTGKYSCDTPNGALLLPDVSRQGGSFSGAATRFALGCTEGTDGGICEEKQFLRVSSALSATLEGFKKANGLPITEADFASLCSATASAGNGGAIDVLIDPGLIVTNGTDIFAELGLSLKASPVTNVINDLINLIPVLGPILTGAIDQGADLLNQVVPIVVDQPLNTGPLVFRMRHVKPMYTSAGEVDGSKTERALRIPGKLVGDCNANGEAVKPRLSTVISLYTDIPEINAKADVALLKTLAEMGIPVIGDIAGLAGIPIIPDAQSNTDITNLKVSGSVEFLDDGRLTARLVNDTPVRLRTGLAALGGLVGGELFVTVPKGRFVLNSALAPLKN